MPRFCCIVCQRKVVSACSDAPGACSPRLSAPAPRFCCLLSCLFTTVCPLLQLQEEQLPLDALGPLAVLSSLRCLGLQGCDASISQHCPWHCFPQLTLVDLHGSCVSDLTPLQVRLLCLWSLSAYSALFLCCPLSLSLNPETGELTQISSKCKVHKKRANSLKLVQNVRCTKNGRTHSN
jgi:hypothetical protein